MKFNHGKLYIRDVCKRQKRKKKRICTGLFLICAVGIALSLYQNKKSRPKAPVGIEKNIVKVEGKSQTTEENNNNSYAIEVDNSFQKKRIPKQKKETKPVKVRGIYVTAMSAGSEKKIDEIITMVNETELNAVVIDVKDDYGYISYEMDYDKAKEVGATKNTIQDIHTVIDKLKKNGIYVIGRVVAFKDPVLANHEASLCLKTNQGAMFRDKTGNAWLNPYKRDTWEYIVTVAKKAVEVGFDEIQFDYVRFSTDHGMKSVVYEADSEAVTKVDIITEFVKYACQKLRPIGAYVSADVYGSIIDSEVDARIVGQNYLELARCLDYISPMIYPSHYGAGCYGLAVPDLQPYHCVVQALKKSAMVLGQIEKQEHRAIVRPWLQDFTAKWLKEYQVYEEKQLREQIQAVYDAGYQEWILWNGGSRYTMNGLLPEEN